MVKYRIGHGEFGLKPWGTPSVKAMFHSIFLLLSQYRYLTRPQILFAFKDKHRVDRQKGV